MKRILITLIAAVAFTGVAQYIDHGAVTKTDEFEGTFECTQAVTDQNSRIWLQLVFALHDDTPPMMLINRTGITREEAVFPQDGSTQGDEILVRFPSTAQVERLEVVLTTVRHVHEGAWQESIVATIPPELIRQLITTDEDIRYRLSPANGTNYDDTLPAEFLNEFSEFLEECM